MDSSKLYQVFNSCSEVSTDSRNLPENCLFVALKGPNFNGNKYAEEALKKGASYALIDEDEYKVNERCILVKDCLQALQDLAHYHRAQLNIPVIAIVGSNGKTTTKELMYAILSEKYKTLATPGNLNNHIGVPLTLLKLKEDHEIAVIEMGANHPGENALLCEIAAPDFGLVTNVGKDHLEGFGSIEGVEKANAELYEYFHKNGGLAFVNKKDQILLKRSALLKGNISYAGFERGKENAEADCIGLIESMQPFIQFTLEKNLYESWNGKSYKADYNGLIKSNLFGQYNFDNVMAAVCVAEYFGVPASNIKAAIESYIPKNNRSQVINKGSNTIYLDAYNANPSSMEAALKAFASMHSIKKVVILGDMFELGEHSEKEHQQMVNLCNELNFDKLILVGEEFKKHSHLTRCHTFPNADSLKNFLHNEPLRDSHILVKGSRGMKLETAIEF